MSTTAAVPLTDWFGPDVKPVRVGVYETKFRLSGSGSCSWFCLWNGSYWGNSRGTPAQATVPSCNGVQNKSWRGRRCWVLVDRNGYYLTGLRPLFTFQPGAENARPFKNERAALRFAARYKWMRLTAVLP